MAQEGHIPPRDHGREEALAPMEYGTPPEILPIEMAFGLPYSPTHFYLTSLLLFLVAFTSLSIVSSFLYEQALCYNGSFSIFFYSFKSNEGTFKTMLCP